MSFDIFMCCVRHGETAFFKRALVDEIFGRGAIDPYFPLGSVEYEDGSGGEIYGADDAEKDEIDGIMVTHCGGDTFFQALYELADRTGSFIFWPDNEMPNMAVPRASVIEDMPPELIEDCRPSVVSDGRELQDAIFGPKPADPPPALQD